MENSVIKVLNRRHGLKVLNYFDLQGIDTANFWGNCTEESNGIAIYYGVINDKFSNYTLEEVKAYSAKIIELPKEENSFPKVMLVSRDGKAWYKRVVFMKKCDRFLSWINAETIEESESSYEIISWYYAKELPEKVELTKSEIAEKFGISVDQLVIKDD